jgi:hypothetical protein
MDHPITLGDLKRATQEIVWWRIRGQKDAPSCRAMLQQIATRYRMVTGDSPSLHVNRQCSPACWIRLLAANE